MSTIGDYVRALRIEFRAPSPAMARYIEAQAASADIPIEVPFEEWQRLTGATSSAFQEISLGERDQCWRVAASVGIFREQNRL